jgi:hypothetical protein
MFSCDILLKPKFPGIDPIVIHAIDKNKVFDVDAIIITGIRDAEYVEGGKFSRYTKHVIHDIVAKADVVQTTVEEIPVVAIMMVAYRQLISFLVCFCNATNSYPTNTRFVCRHHN